MGINPESSDSKNELPLDIEELQIERRFAVVDEWLSAVSHVARQAGVALAEEVADFLVARATLGIACSAGGIFLRRHQKPELDASDCVFLTPLLDIDSRRRD